MPVLLILRRLPRAAGSATIALVALKARRIEGAPGSGKTHALLVEMCNAAHSGIARSAIALVIPAGPSPLELRERLRELDPAADEYRVLTFSGLAASIVEHDAATQRAPAPRIIDDVEAADIFASVCDASLEFGGLDDPGGDLDPEVSGLRSPERFAAAAFALIGKLRGACIDADEFERICLRGAATFYANPPNFSDVDLLLATKDAHRRSLSVDGTELERQRQREIDLAKILAAVYRAYLQYFGTETIPLRDVVPQALERLRASAALRAHVQASFARLCIDDAQECTVAEFELVRELCGNDLARLTFAFDDSLTIGAFSGARPKQWAALDCDVSIANDAPRSPEPIAQLARDFQTKPAKPQPAPSASPVTLYHTLQKGQEAAFIAERIAGLRDGAKDAPAIALILRTLQGCAPYERALLERGIDVDVTGDTSPLRSRATLDVLAALWVACNPYRHEWLLRFLQAPPLCFPDATLALLCAEGPSPQESLFGPELGAAQTAGTDRTLRLARHVFRGDIDEHTPADVREKLAWLRERAQAWHALRERSSLTAHAALVLHDLNAPARSGNPAQDAADARSVARMLESLEHYEFLHPGARLEDALAHIERIGESEHARTGDGRSAGCVALLSISAARGRTFDHVFVANVHAGAFPRYYTPDAFLFSPSLGIVAKDNAGGTQAARTAKYTYYDFRYKPAAAYYEHERRMLTLAMLRARRSLTITASERPTRGIGAPEFLIELRALRPEYALLS